MKRALLLVPLAGCPKGGDAKGPAPGEVYAGIFEPQRQWTYDVVELEGGEGGRDEYQISCQVTDQRDFPDGKLAVIACDGAFGEGFAEAVAGTWAADARGLWYLPEVLYEDLADATGMPKDAMTDARMLRLEQTSAGMCTRDEEPASPDASWTRFCFADGGVTSGNLGWASEPREVQFQEAEDED